MTRALSILAALALCGCGATFAAPCTATADCQASQVCLTAAPAGFCGHGCAVEGETRDCPGGARCTFFGGSTLTCSPTCTADDQCRASYACREAGTSGQRTCQPASVTR